MTYGWTDRQTDGQTDRQSSPSQQEGEDLQGEQKMRGEEGERTSIHRHPPPVCQVRHTHWQIVH